MRVKTNALYRFKRHGWDMWDRKNAPDISDGTIVRVIRCHGCPPPNTMGHCHIATLEGEFIGLVSTASLEKR